MFGTDLPELFIGGYPPGLGGTPPMRGVPPMRVPGFLGWGTGFFWGVPRVFIDALDR